MTPERVYPSLVLVRPRKTRPYITERLLMGRKESNQTNKQTNDSWDCQNSNYLYPSAGHVTTGNLNVIPDARVRNIFSTGPKYRFSSNIDFLKCRREIAACSYFQCAPFLRLKTGKVVWVLSFDHQRVRINTAFRYSYVISVFWHFLDKIKYLKCVRNIYWHLIRTDRLSTKNR